MSAITEQPTGGFTVTPSDTVNIGSGGVPRMPVNIGAILYIGAAGDVTVTTEGGDTVTFLNVPSGFILPVKCIKVWISTTATGIVALY